MSEAERKKTLNSVKALLDYAINHMEKADEGQKKKHEIAQHWKEYLFDPKNKTFDAHFANTKLTIPFDVDDLAKQKTATTTPAAPATPTVITKKVEPQPIIWLGRGYMGDAND